MFSADEQSHNNILTHCSLLLLFQGWYIVTYALAIYHLNLLLAFLTPKIDPAYAEFEAAEAEAEGDDMALPTTKNDEFRPFIR